MKYEQSPPDLPILQRVLKTLGSSLSIQINPWEIPFSQNPNRGSCISFGDGKGPFRQRRSYILATRTISKPSPENGSRGREWIMDAFAPCDRLLIRPIKKSEAEGHTLQAPVSFM
jgi:hypothetical protein